MAEIPRLDLQAIDNKRSVNLNEIELELDQMQMVDNLDLVRRNESF